MSLAHASTLLAMLLLLTSSSCLALPCKYFCIYLTAERQSEGDGEGERLLCRSYCSFVRLIIIIAIVVINLL